MKRGLKIFAIVLVVLIVIVVAIPFFIDANVFRPRLESDLSATVGRQVKVGNLSLSLLSGGVKADDISIADDPVFSNSPFVQAKSLAVGVQLIPLIFSKSLQVTDLTLNQPQISLVRSENGEKWNFSSLGTKSAAPAASGQPTPAQPTSAAPRTTTQPASESSSSGNPNLTVAKLVVTDGRLTISRAKSGEKPRVYDKVNMEVKDFSFTSSFPFTVTANLPAGGTLKLEGKAGPINTNDAALTPLRAKVSIQHMDLAASGFIDPASGISGIADFDGTVTSDGHEAKTAGTLKATKLQVVQKGSPAGKPVELQYAVAADLVKQSGHLTQGDVAMGKAVAHLTGTYDAHGATTVVNMKLSGQGMPVDDLEAMLPALGVVLPPKSTLKGGTLNTNLAIDGPVNKLVTTGTVRLENSALAGFDLGSRLQAISALSGKAAGGNDTHIQNFSSDVHVAPDGTRAENINLTIPAFGVLTGAGTVSPSNALNFKMNANLSGGAVTGVTQMAGLGSKGGAIPFFIQGTTSDPKFVPDVKGMASGVAGGLLQQTLQGNQGTPGQNNPLGGLTGLFKKKKPK
jgi:AsmA protein